MPIIVKNKIQENKMLKVSLFRKGIRISFVLRFNDASHFVKYFKRFTGFTPQNYRVSLV
jgi:AraC family transcriptional activator of pobA